MSMAAVANAVDALTISADRHELLEAFAVRDRFDAKLLTAVGAYEAAGGHEQDGPLTMTAWLRHLARRDEPTARRMSFQGRKLRALPCLRAAFKDGRVSGGQVDIVLAHVRLRHLDLFAEHEAAVVPTLERLDIEGTRAAMAQWRAYADSLEDRKPPPEHDSELYLSRTIDDRGELRGSLDADLTATVEAALRVADPKDLGLAPSERRADALGTVCRFFLDHQTTRRGGRHRPHVNVVVHETSATYLDTGQRVSKPELGSLLCDSTVHRILVDQRSAILDYGRATRTWPVDLYNAIAARDQGCRWPGCDRPASWTDVHHVHEWEDGGHTAIDNGVMLCRRHHRRLHADRWSAKLLPDGTFEVTHPDGRTDRTEARGPSSPPLWCRRRGDGG